MRNNYCSFLNTIFAVNKFLKYSFLVNKKFPVNLSQKRVQEIAKCFITAFPENRDVYFKNIYFSENFDQIASRIGLEERLKIVREEFDAY